LRSRVGRVALAATAAADTIRTVDLDDLDAALLQQVAQPGAFHAGAVQHAKALSPTQKMLVAGRVCCDREKLTAAIMPLVAFMTAAAIALVIHRCIAGAVSILRTLLIVAAMAPVVAIRTFVINRLWRQVHG
jgi:hypothetical protein